MILRYPPTLHWCRASFETHSLAQTLTLGAGRRNQLFASPSNCEISNTARCLSQRRAVAPPVSKRAILKADQAPVSGPRKPAAYEPLTNKLALRTSPTLLYQAPSYTNYIFGCYAVGIGLLAAGWFNFQTQFYVQPGGVPPWVPRFTSVGSFMIVCGGFYMLLKVRRFGGQVLYYQIDHDASHRTWSGPSAVFRLQPNRNQGLSLCSYKSNEGQ